jgi:putative two-component system response regulator
MNNLASATILAVDDVNTNLDILVNTLGNHYDLLVTTNGVGALQLASEDPPDLILLDVMMPGMDGFTVLQK